MMLPDKFIADYKAMYRCDFRNDVKSWRRVIFSGSMLIGNPGVIHHKDCATDDYFPAVS